MFKHVNFGKHVELELPIELESVTIRPNKNVTIFKDTDRLSSSTFVGRQYNNCRLDISGVHRKGPQNQNY